MNSDLLERADERAALADVLARPRGALLVHGPVGIGKSALLDDARAGARVRVCFARGSELESDIAFGGVRQLFNDVEPLADEPDPEVLRALFEHAVALAPVALVIDDAQWLDRPTLRFFVYLLNRIANLPLALVLTVRDGDNGELLRRIIEHPAVRSLALPPLSIAAVAQIVGAERAPAVYDSTGGVPFYVHALAAQAAHGTSPTAMESAIQRLNRLPPACTALARAIAVLGHGGSLAAQVAGLDVRAAVEAAESLKDVGLLDDAGLPHWQLIEAVYAAIPPARRAELHMNAARVETGSERIAAHLIAAGPGGGVWAARTLRNAAATAWARGAPDVAATFLHRAAEEDLPRDELVPLLRELARALIATGASGGLFALRQALALGGAERGEIALELGRALFSQGQFADACEAFEAGLAAVRAATSATSNGAGASNGASGGARGDGARGSARGDDADGEASDDDADGGARGDGAGGGIETRLRVELATVAVLDLKLVRRFGGLDAIAARLPAGASAVRAWIDVARHAPAARGADLAEASLDHAEPTSLAGALVALMAAGRLARADELWTRIAADAHASGALETLRMAIAIRALVRVREGRAAEAEADLRELLGWISARGRHFRELRLALPWVIAPLVDALVERDALDEAERWVRDTGLERDWPELLGFTFLIDSLARLRLAQGRAPEALQLAREAGRRQKAWGIRNPGFVAWGSTLAAAAFATGRRAEALDAADQQADLAAAFGVTREHELALRELRRIEAAR